MDGTGTEIQEFSIDFRYLTLKLLYIFHCECLFFSYVQDYRLSKSEFKTYTECTRLLLHPINRYVTMESNKCTFFQSLFS